MVDLLQKAGMAECQSTPVDSRAKLSASEGAPVDDPTMYWSLTGSLQYLTLTRPDMAYAMQQVCLLMHDPCKAHLVLIKNTLVCEGHAIRWPPHRHWACRQADCMLRR